MSVILYRALPLAIALALVVLLRLSGLGIAGQGRQSITIALSFMLLAAFIGGRAAMRLKLPRISGYLIVGILVGPDVSGLLTSDMLLASKTIQGLAVTLIALTAGGEIRVHWLRQHLRKLTVITALQVVIVGACVALFLFLARGFVGFVPDDDLLRAAVVAVCVAAVAISNSPTVTIAVIADNRAEGPLSRTVLGVVVLVDLVVIVSFAATVSLARHLLTPGMDGPPVALRLAWELLGSVAAGIISGIGIGAYFRYLNRDVPVFVLAYCLVASQLADLLHLEPLLLALAAGFWVENFSRRGDQLIKAIERISTPVYALFFAAAGAKVQLRPMLTYGPIALLLCLIRIAGIWIGARVGAKLVSLEEAVRGHLWLGLVSQAGVTLALSAMLSRTFPDWGEGAGTVILAMVALNELIGPVGFELALRRSGEAGKAGS